MASKCKSRACDKAADGVGPLTGISLCRNHLDKEHTKVKEKQAEFVEKLHLLTDKDRRNCLRNEQSSLEAEVQQVSDMFELLIEKVQRWRVKTVSRVQAAHDSVAIRLRDASEAEECEKELMTISDEGDMKKVVELMSSAESWFDEACDRSSEFERIRSRIRERQSKELGQMSSKVDVRCVGDVSAGVQQLMNEIDKHMSDLMRQCWIDDEAELNNLDKLQLHSSLETVVDDLPNEPRHVTCCTNTKGFLSDTSGWIIKAGEPSAFGCVSLPKCCIFVSFDEDKRADYLLVTSFDGAVRLKYQTTLDWSEWISGLHCDSKRQLLYIAQYLKVTVTDLSGSVKMVLNSSNIGLGIQRITAMTGNSDKLMLLDRQAAKVISVSKESNKVESVVSFESVNTGTIDEMALSGSKILLVDYQVGCVLKLCGISGQFIAAYPAKSSSANPFQLPGMAVVDSNGLIYVSEANGQSVRVLSEDGRTQKVLRSGILHEIQNNPLIPLQSRFCLALLENESHRCVVLTNEEEKSLHIFHLPRVSLA